MTDYIRSLEIVLLAFVALHAAKDVQREFKIAKRRLVHIRASLNQGSSWRVRLLRSLPIMLTVSIAAAPLAYYVLDGILRLTVSPVA